jgi:uncharacterized protein (TIRG00374 family)
MKKYWHLVWHILVLGGLIFAATKYIDGKEAWRAFRAFNWIYAIPVLLLTVSYLLVKGWRFVRVLDQLQDIDRWVVMRGYIAAQAATLLPGGLAARAGILEQAGVPVAKSAAAIAHSSLSDQAMLISCSLLSALWFETARKPVAILLAALIAISILLGLEATRTWLLQIVEWIASKLHWRGHWHKFIASMKDVSTLPNILAGLANAALACILMVEALDLCVRGIGAQVSYPTLLLAFTLPSLLGRISAMPGGVGVTEAGMVGVLDASPGVSLHEAAAAVFLFRIGTVLFAAVLGALCYFFGWKGTAEEASDEMVETTPQSTLKPDSLLQSTLTSNSNP